MGRFREYIEIEKKLEKKYSKQKENEVRLSAEDFKDGKLSSEGFFRLKQQCEYIPYSDDIEIIIPLKHAEGFRNKLEYMAAAELSKIKKDKKYATILSFILLLVGAFWYSVSYLFPVDLGREISVIITWVFIWAGVEKWFFERHQLREKRFNLLQILSAKVREK